MSTSQSAGVDGDGAGGVGLAHQRCDAALGAASGSTPGFSLSRPKFTSSSGCQEQARAKPSKFDDARPVGRQAGAQLDDADDPHAADC